MRFSQVYEEHLSQIFQWRRDVRHFSMEELPDETLKALENSIDYAPSVGNSRPWRIVRVATDTQTQIVELFERSNAAAGEIYLDEAKSEYAKLKLAGLKEAPVHWAFFTKIDPDEGHGLGRQSMPETLTYSTVMAIHTLWLAARAMNIGVGWVSILEPKAVCELLDVPSTWQFTGYLCIGYAIGSQKEPELHRLNWQENTKTVWLDR